MAAIKEGGVTQNESLLPKFLHKKRWITITIFLRYISLYCIGTCLIIGFFFI